MRQIVVYTFIISLMVNLEYVKGTISRTNVQDLNFTRPFNNILINGATPNNFLFDARMFSTRTPYYSAVDSDKNSNSMLNFPTLKAHLHNSQRLSNSLFNFPTLKARSHNSQRLSNSMLHSSTLRTRTLDFQKVKARSFNFSTFRYRSVNSPSLKHGTLSQKRSNSILNSPILKSRALNFPTLNIHTLRSPKFSYRTLHSPTHTIRTLNSPIFNARTVNFHKMSIRTLKVPTPRTRTVNSPTHTRTLNYNILSSQKLSKRTLNAALPNTQTLNNKIFDDQKFNEWLKDSIVEIPNDEIKDSRRSHIEGLMHFKRRVNHTNEKQKNRSDFNDDDIIPNDKYELDNIMAYSGAVPNFKESFVDKAAERFEKIQSEYLKYKVKEIEKSGRRDNEGRKRTKKPNVMDRILALMNQFIAQSHYKLINGELLRMKYVENIKFKIGYVFALLRILKQQQMTLYSSMHFNRFFPPIVKGLWYTPVADAMYYLFLYEKIMRLDDDIITTVRYLWALEADRVKEAIINAKKPKRKKVTLALQQTYVVTIPKYGG